MKVLYEDNHLFVVAKPPGLATMGTPAGTPTLLEEAKAHIKQKYDKPGAVYLGIVSRLDAPVTGLVLLARTSKAASRLSEAFRDRKVEKVYAAIVEGEAPPCTEPVIHHLRKDERHRKVHTTHAAAPGAQRAELSYEVVSATPQRSLLVVRPVTGRKHQIRVQLAKIGLPILGDRKYGSAVPVEPGIALHSWRLTLEHPVRREPITLVAPLPPIWRKWFPHCENLLSEIF